MEPARRRLKSASGNENANPAAARTAAKAAIAKPAAPRAALSAVNGAVPKRIVAVVGKKPAESAPKAASRLQVKKVKSPCDIRQLVKAFQAGHVPQARKAPAIRPATHPGFVDVDVEDDPQLVAVYVKDIMVHLKALEDKYPVKTGYLAEHAAVRAKHRGVLVNWMVEVVGSFKMTKETLHLSVGLVDRYLGVNVDVPTASLQLVGVAAMFVAHKYEETFVVDISDWVYICDNAYTKREILAMEMDMLTKLDFGLGRPTAIAFLRRYHKVVSASARQHELGKYLVEQALLEYELAAVKPSVLAAAAACLAQWLLTTLERPADAWSALQEFYSGYAYGDIADAVARAGAMIGTAEKSKLQEVRKIYAQDEHLRIVLDQALRKPKLRTFVAAAAASATSS